MSARAPLLRRLRRSLRLATFVAGSLIVYSTSGCLSNQYEIPRDELTRLVQLPPDARGARVHVVQELGQREADPVPAEPPPGPWAESHADVHLDVVGTIDLPGPNGGGRGRVAAGDWHGPRPPASPGPARRRGWRGGASGSGGGGNLHLPSGGGGKDDLAVLAVVVAVVAAFAVVGLAASEGSRFDGYTQLYPQQVVHLKNAGGEELTMPLGALTPAEVSEAVSARVQDDEGYGLHRLDRRPLDRVGATYKMSVGSLLLPPPAGAPQLGWQGGVTTDIQVGGFFTQGVGLLATLSLGGGSTPDHQTFLRHGLGVELQTFPLRAGPLSLGAFGHGGVAFVYDGAGYDSGPAVGGGLMAELALTTRLAFTVRGDWTGAHLQGPSGWNGHTSITAGLAIY
jgi:hypothetical protein